MFIRLDKKESSSYIKMEKVLSDDFLEI